MTKQIEYHPSFPQPSNPSVSAWRYMDLAKLLSLVSKRELYLRRLDLLPDKYEGLYPRRVRTALAEFYAKSGLTEKEAIELANHRVDFAKESRQMMFVSCWHLGDHESEAMWRIYCGGENGLAIVLPYDELRTSVSDGTAWIGTVSYLDFDTDLLAPGNTFVVALHKRREFAYEQEARILSFGSYPMATPADRPPSISLPSGSPFSLPFSIKNRSVFFSMKITEITCEYGRMTGPHLHFSDSEQTASHGTTIRPGGVFNFRCAVTNPVPNLITEASVRLIVRYTFPWSSRPRCQSNPLDWAKTTDGGRWVMGSTDDACVDAPSGV